MPTPAPVRGTAAMIGAMAPVLRPGRWIFCATDDPGAVALALASFREDEGMSLVLPEADALRLDLDAGQPQACITLTVHSALDGVGLTAAVAGALAVAGIPCNMVAALRHDHVFVPADRAEEAVAILRARAAEG